jgi:hypothetical protein
MHGADPEPEVWCHDCNSLGVVRNTKFLEETKMAKSAKKGKLSGKKLEKKAPLTTWQHR